MASKAPGGSPWSLTRQSRSSPTQLVGSLFLQLLQRRLGNRNRVRASPALLARARTVLDYVNHCLTSCHDRWVAVSLVGIEVFPRLSHGCWLPAPLLFGHGQDRSGFCFDGLGIGLWSAFRCARGAIHQSDAPNAPRMPLDGRSPSQRPRGPPDDELRSASHGQSADRCSRSLVGIWTPGGSVGIRIAPLLLGSPRG